MSGGDAHVFRRAHTPRLPLLSLLFTRLELPFEFNIKFRYTEREIHYFEYYREIGGEGDGDGRRVRGDEPSCNRG